MSFTKNLYTETKSSHTAVDKHPFVSAIRTNKLAAELYISFNKICIVEIQKVLVLKDPILFKRLYRDINVPQIQNFPALTPLLMHCQNHPLESSYQFYLGLLFGGSMLKRMIPEHAEFLTYVDPKPLIQDFKQYLDDNIVNDVDQQAFINVVNKCYKLIKQLFDEFLISIS
jgi:heme oxygenase